MSQHELRVESIACSYWLRFVAGRCWCFDKNSGLSLFCAIQLWFRRESYHDAGADVTFSSGRRLMGVDVVANASDGGSEGESEADTRNAGIDSNIKCQLNAAVTKNE